MWTWSSFTATPSFTLSTQIQELSSPPLPRSSFPIKTELRCDMNRELLTFVILLSVAALAVSAFSTHRSQDEVAIHKVETGLQEAWNHHDAKAFASFFTEDANCVNVVGWWKGRPQIEKKVADAHVLMFCDSVVTNNEIHFRFLTSEVAVVHV